MGRWLLQLSRHPGRHSQTVIHPPPFISEEGGNHCGGFAQLHCQTPSIVIILVMRVNTSTTLVHPRAFHQPARQTPHL